MSTIAELEKEVAELKDELSDLQDVLEQNQLNLDLFTTYLLVLIDKLHPDIETSEMMLNAIKAGQKALGKDAPEKAIEAYAYSVEKVEYALP